MHEGASLIGTPKGRMMIRAKIISGQGGTMAEMKMSKNSRDQFFFFRLCVCVGVCAHFFFFLLLFVLIHLPCMTRLSHFDFIAKYLPGFAETRKCERERVASGIMYSVRCAWFLQSSVAQYSTHWPSKGWPILFRDRDHDSAGSLRRVDWFSRP